ncbi:hypothetical protein [Chryseobacterium taihuense]|uniref:Signal peptidase n=1 Tax=Chryseobacterium taihuense TaxID=1141221 RepID=A0ABY0R178_9FLAO|nr:hypothetical protein [Chryseobacterium taihuense]SDM25092.1 hypothetical protein SAMN05216273_11877 [Chryseobacterium taihuense]
MKFIAKRVLITIFLVVFGLYQAQDTPGTPCFPGSPCDPPSSPINMYQYLLGLAGIFIISYYVYNKHKIQKI